MKQKKQRPATLSGVSLQFGVMSTLLSLFLFLLLAAQNVASLYPNMEFVKKQISGNWIGIQSMVTSSDNFIYLTGSFSEPMTIGSQSFSTTRSRMFLAKFDAQGQKIWVITGSGTGYNYGSGLALGKNSDSAHLYQSGYFNNEIILCGSTFNSASGFYTAQFNVADGQCKWISVATPTTNYAAAFDVVVADDGTILTSGYVSGTTNFGSVSVTPSGDDIVVVRYNTNGQYLSVITAGGAGSDRAVAITIDEEDSFYITGYFEKTATFGSCGQVTSMGGWDIFVAKYNRSGSCVWIIRAGGEESELGGYGIAFGEDEFLYVSGEFNGNASFGCQNIISGGLSDVFVSKIDARTGKFVWSVQSGGPGSDSASSISVGNGVVYVSGSFQDKAQFSQQVVNSKGSFDAFLAAYDTANGNTIWVETGGGSSYDSGSEVGLMGVSTVYYTGNFQGTAFFRDTTLSETGAFLAKYNLVTCFQFEANSSSVCSGHGACIANNKCNCDDGYFGVRCEMTTCFGTNSTNNQTCSNHGKCIAFDQCSCDSDWKGENCDEPTCYGLNHTDSNVCSQHGSCISVNVCICSSQYFGGECEMTHCFGVESNSTNVCSGKGECISHDHCLCDSGWFGDNCTVVSCFGIMGNLSEVCSGHGVCSELNQCNCKIGYSGSDCSIPLCNSIEATNSSVCSGNGVCVDVNTCNCSIEYEGLFCDNRLQLERGGTKSQPRTGMIVGATVGSVVGVTLVLLLVLVLVVSIAMISKLNKRSNANAMTNEQVEMSDRGV